MSVSGLLVVDKPRGPTSHDVVAGARRLYRTRAVGHAGTLDPMATGVLVLLFGEATKLAPYLTAAAKTYVATVALGRSTDTLDALGATTEEHAVPSGAPPEASLAAAMLRERSRTEQIPPAFSAVSVDGVRAYRKARRGEEVALAPRPVNVHALELIERRPAELVFSLTVSKGYYVRAFARDLGATLELPCHLGALERRASGPFRIEDAVAWPTTTPPPLLPLADAATRALASARLTADGVVRARQGKPLRPDDFAGPIPDPDTPSAWLSAEDTLIAVGQGAGGDHFRVLRGFQDPAPAEKSS